MWILKKVQLVPLLLSITLSSYSQEKVEIDSYSFLVKTQIDDLISYLPDSIKSIYSGADIDEPLTFVYDSEYFFMHYPTQDESSTKMEVRKIAEKYVIIKSTEGDYGFFDIRNSQVYFLNFNTSLDSFMVTALGKGKNDLELTAKFIIDQFDIGYEVREVLEKMIQRVEHFDY